MVLNPNISGDKFWIQEFTKWLNERAEKSDYSSAPSVWQDMINDWKKQDPNDKTKRDLQKLFGTNSRYATAYANFFGYT